jgi:hypothetical protein
MKNVYYLDTTIHQITVTCDKACNNLRVCVKLKTQFKTKLKNAFNMIMKMNMYVVII